MRLSSSSSQLPLRPARHRREQRMGEFASDRRPDLRELLGWTESVEPRHQRRVQACRDRQPRRGNQGGGSPGLRLRFRLQHRLRHLFHEQRDPVGALDDILAYVGRQRVVADNVIDHRVDFARRQPIEDDGGHVRLFDPGRLELRSEGHDQQYALSPQSSSRADRTARGSWGRPNAHLRKPPAKEQNRTRLPIA